MKNLSIATLLMLGFIGGAQASDAQAQFSSSIASYCSVGQTNPGVMHISGTTVTTDSPAVMQVNNNDGGFYKVQATDAGDFSAKPAGYTGTATLTTSFNSVGANNGTVASGLNLPLDNAGADTLNVSIAGSLSAEAVSGNYSAVSVVSCVAQ